MECLLGELRVGAVMAKSEKISITQIRSEAGRDRKFRNTLLALGLGRIGRTRIHSTSPALLGMVKKVGTVLKVTAAK